MMNKRILLSILLLFLILFILFMFSALSAGVLTEPEIKHPRRRGGYRRRFRVAGGRLCRYGRRYGNR